VIIVKPSVTLEAISPNPLQIIERAGRTCYQSKEDDSKPAEQFVRMILKRGHESVIEHASATLRIVCDRGVTHEIVRHRLASYSQESTRYCNYGKTGEIRVIEPPNLEGEMRKVWDHAVKIAEAGYLAMVENGIKPQIARSILPNCLKTEIVMTCNFREWRHFFKLRCAPAAHPQMREVANMALCILYEKCPVVFEDIFKNEESED